MKFYEESCYFQPVILVISGLRMISVNLRDIYNSESNYVKIETDKNSRMPAQP